MARDYENMPKMLKENREYIEGAVVLTMWKEPELYDEYELDIEKDLYLPESRLLYTLGKKMYNKGINVFDVVSIETYLLNFPDIKSELDGFGGAKEVLTNAKVMNIANFEKSYDDLLKANLLIEVFYTQKDLMLNFEELKKMDTSSDVYDYIEYKILGCASDKVSKNMTEGNMYVSDELIEQIIAGELIESISFHKFAPMLNGILGGSVLGKLHIIAGSSGAGKSTFTTSNIFYPHICEGEKVCLISNEMTKNEILMMLFCIVATDKFKNWKLTREKMTKRNPDGSTKLTDEDIKTLKEVQAYINEHIKDNFYFIDFSDADVNNVVKMIRKYSKLGVKTFCYDTMKADNSADAKAWASIIEHSKLLTFTAQKNNIALYLTYQVAPHANDKRWLHRGLLSEGKGVVFMAHSLILIRPVRYDEMPNERYDLKPYRKVFDEDKGEWIRKPFEFSEQDLQRRYILVFIDKNRSGDEGDVLMYQFWGNNARYREIGFAKPAIDM